MLSGLLIGMGLAMWIEKYDLLTPFKSYKTLVSSGTIKPDKKNNRYLTAVKNNYTLPGFETSVDWYGDYTFKFVGCVSNLDKLSGTNYFESVMSDLINRLMGSPDLQKGAIYLDIPIEVTDILPLTYFLTELKFNLYYISADCTRIVFYKWNSDLIVDKTRQLGTNVAAAKLLIVSLDGKYILLTKERKDLFNPNAGFKYSTPGGVGNRNESYFGIVKREVKEEINYEIDTGSDIYLVGGVSEANGVEGQFNNSSVSFMVYVDKDTFICEPDGVEIIGTEWISIESIVNKDASNLPEKFYLVPILENILVKLHQSNPNPIGLKIRMDEFKDRIFSDKHIRVSSNVKH
jgi:8-oxo-dGTP pyrophosphatase MutT (NUDIX family)